MNFDFGETLSRAWQIGWRHKSLWGLLLISVFTGMLFFSLFAIFFFTVIYTAELDLPEFMPVVFVAIFLLLTVASNVVNYAARSASNAAIALGIVRVEREEGSTQFMDLLRDARPYFWRTLGVLLTVNLTAGLAMSLFYLLMFVLIIVTIGMASYCMQPITFMLTPFTFLLNAALEGAQTAIVAGNMGVMDALRHALRVIRKHFWKYVLVTLIIYLGTSIVTSLLAFPLMMPFFMLPLLLNAVGEVSTQGVVMTVIAVFSLSIPVLVLLFSPLGIFSKIMLALTYFRLSTPVQDESSLQNPT